MLLHIILFSVVLKSITCQFPSFITKCPLPDPNANDCLLNSAKIGFSNIVGGYPDLGLPSYNTIYFNGDSLILEYNSETSNTEIQIYGQMVQSNDMEIEEARINLNWQNWNFVATGSSSVSYFDFTLNIYDVSRTIQAKGQINLIQDNWKFHYFGDYVTETIDNENYMQIRFGSAYVIDDTFDVTYSSITTLDDQPVIGADLIRVKKALRGFENAYHSRTSALGSEGFTLALNTILQLVPEDQIFIPLVDQCPQNN